MTYPPHRGGAAPPGPPGPFEAVAGQARLRLARAVYLTAFACGWLLFGLAPLPFVSPGLGPLRLPGMLAGAALVAAATGRFARALRCPWRDSLLLALSGVPLFPAPLLLLTRCYRQVRRANLAPLGRTRPNTSRRFGHEPAGRSRDDPRGGVGAG